MSIFVSFYSTHDLHQLKKAPPPGYSGYVCEICWNLNYYVISCVRVALCRPGVFAFWCCTIKVDIENSKGQYIEKDKQEATKDGSESTKIQHGI